MNKYVEYIEELLYLYDCVIIPNFGGFIGVHTSATVDENTGNIMPPSKHIVFNKYLQQNDGLLINWISRKEQMPYEKAERRLSLFQEELKVRLNQKEQINFGSIGTFSTDKRFNIVFTPSERNFLVDVLGMQTLTTGIHATTSKKVINMDNGNLITRLCKYGVSAAIIAGIVIISQQDFFKTDDNINTTGIQPTSVRHNTPSPKRHAVISPEQDFVDYDPLIEENN